MNRAVGDRFYETDTHQVGSDGQHGCIWPFTEINAELRMAAALHDLAESDPPTSLPIRRHFEERYAGIIAVALGQSLSQSFRQSL